MENMTKEQIDRLIKCVEALKVMSDPHGKFDTDYLKGKYDAYASVIGLIPVVKMNPIPTEKEIMFCDKCGEAYQVKFAHECLTASGSVAAPKEEAEATLGVGDGSSQHFVRGSYDTIKLLQGKLLRMEKSETELAAAKESIKDLIPIAEKTHNDLARHQIIYVPSGDGTLTKRNKLEIWGILDRAKALLDKQ